MDLTLLMTVDPAAISRAQRLAYAMRMVKNGAPRAEVSRSLIAHFEISRKTAYRIVSMAFDLASGR